MDGSICDCIRIVFNLYYGIYVTIAKNDSPEGRKGIPRNECRKQQLVGQACWAGCRSYPESGAYSLGGTRKRRGGCTILIIVMLIMARMIMIKITIVIMIMAVYVCYSVVY